MDGFRSKYLRKVSLDWRRHNPRDNIGSDKSLDVKYLKSLHRDES